MNGRLNGPYGNCGPTWTELYEDADSVAEKVRVLRAEVAARSGGLPQESPGGCHGACGRASDDDYHAMVNEINEEGAAPPRASRWS